MEALGRLFNYRHLADAGYVRMDQCGGVTFFCYLAAAAGDTYTLSEAKTSTGGSVQTLATITRWWTCTGDGTDTWTLHTQAAASTVVTAASAAENGMCVEVDGVELSDTFKYLKLASTGAGLVTAVQRDLVVARKPSSLPAVTS
jgi:hypothetical protein